MAYPASLEKSATRIRVSSPTMESVASLYRRLEMEMLASSERGGVGRSRLGLWGPSIGCVVVGLPLLT